MTAYIFITAGRPHLFPSTFWRLRLWASAHRGKWGQLTPPPGKMDALVCAVADKQVIYRDKTATDKDRTSDRQ